MGGLAAANASSLRPDADFSLLLIAPAFGLIDLWRNSIGEDGLNQWKEEGCRAYHHHGFNEDILLGWDFIETAKQMSWPEIAHPTVILHGTEDDVVPIEVSRKMNNDNANIVALLEIDDGHRMQRSKSHFERAAELLRHN
jgi:pimeloyl-ACP methyl ester carboxylesterase